MYAIPHEYYEKYSIRRYGFHGTSHMFVSTSYQVRQLRSREGKSYYVCHLEMVPSAFYWRQVDTSMYELIIAGNILDFYYLGECYTTVHLQQGRKRCK